MLNHNQLQNTIVIVFNHYTSRSSFDDVLLLIFCFICTLFVFAMFLLMIINYCKKYLRFLLISKAPSLMNSNSYVKSAEKGKKWMSQDITRLNHWTGLVTNRHLKKSGERKMTCWNSAEEMQPSSSLSASSKTLSQTTSTSSELSSFLVKAIVASSMSPRVIKWSPSKSITKRLKYIVWVWG